jgi:hypothetical protein
MMASTAPYRLQIFLPDDVREALREVAHRERVSQQRLVLSWLIEKLQQYPEGEHLHQEEEKG